MIKRNIFKILEKNLSKKQIMALIGSRQVGKTTLMKQLYEKYANDEEFLSFEDLEIRNLFENNIQIFIELYVKNKKYLFIDEFQYVKLGGQKLKYIYDSFKIKIIISGSSKPELAIQSLQYLVGRLRIFEIFPLSFDEFLEYKDKNKKILLSKNRKSQDFKIIDLYFEEYLKYGGYPDVVLEEDLKEKEMILKDIINTYLLKEIKDILAYKNLYEFENILKKISLQDGKLLNKNSFSQDLEINKNKVNQIINTLNSTYILSLVQPFLKNKSKELIKSPKTYLQDLGFKNYLINNFNNLDLKHDKGEIYENFIYNQLFRNGVKVNFWNQKNRYEMDFVFEKDSFIYGFEIKSKLQNNNLSNSIKHFINTFNPKKIFILNENIDDIIELDNTEIIFTNYLNIFNILDEIIYFKKQKI